MGHIIEDCSDPGLGEAIEVNWFDWFKPWSHAPQVQFHETDYMKRLTTRVPHSMWNGVFLARLMEDNVHEKIEENIEHFKELRLPWHWFVGPSSRPIDLEQRLVDQGFTLTHHMPGMAVEIEYMKDDFSIPQEFTVKQVKDLGTLRDFVHVAMNVMNLFKEQSYEFFLYEATAIFDDEIPRYDYVGYLEGVPVATSILVCSERVAGVNTVCTLPEVRGKGIGTEMSLVTLREARRLRYKVGVLLSSEMGYNIYKRIGFERLCRIGFYKSP